MRPPVWVSCRARGPGRAGSGVRRGRRHHPSGMRKSAPAEQDGPFRRAGHVGERGFSGVASLAFPIFLRARGKQASTPSLPALRGPFPACAGKATTEPAVFLENVDHFPRARGKQCSTLRPRVGILPFPACAGKASRRDGGIEPPVPLFSYARKANGPKAFASYMEGLFPRAGESKQDGGRDGEALSSFPVRW